MILQSCISDEPGALQITPQVPVTLQLEVSTDNVTADNYTYATITATTAIQNNESIVFTTDKGIFSNGETIYTINALSGEPVRAYLKCNKAEMARVTATISNSTVKEVLVNFVPAYPTSIIVNPSVSTLPAAFISTTLVNTKLIRLNGNVSEGMVATYKDSTGIPDGTSIGVFLNNSFADAQGNAVVQYWLQDDTYHGFLYIIVEIETDAGIVRGLNRIFIN